MYPTRRSSPVRSPTGRYTDWSTLKPLCGQVRMFSTTSGSILSPACRLICAASRLVNEAFAKRPKGARCPPR